MKALIVAGLLTFSWVLASASSEPFNAEKKLAKQVMASSKFREELKKYRVGKLYSTHVEKLGGEISGYPIYGLEVTYKSMGESLCIFGVPFLAALDENKKSMRIEQLFGVFSDCPLK